MTHWQTRLAQTDSTLRIHLLGIGGAGLSAIATVLLESGFTVSGSDRQLNAQTARLAELGAQISEGQRAENLTDLTAEQRPDVVLISSAVGADNPERAAAAALGLPVVKRNQFLAELLRNRRVIGVAGTHGKSTTTAMIVQVLGEAGLDAGYIIGTQLPGFGSASAGHSDWFVIEADEYDGMFLGLCPQIAVVTNVEWDHPDCYPTPQRFMQAFEHFIDNVVDEGAVVACMDDAGAAALRLACDPRAGAATGERTGPCWLGYGLDPHADLHAAPPRTSLGHTRTQVTWWHAPVGELRLLVPGDHNVRNALAALAVAACCDVPVEQALASLRNFRGTSRRFEQKGEAQGVTVIDDYAHHPTEVRATLAAARQRFRRSGLDQNSGGRLWAIFQPHTFSRTHALLADLHGAFDDADRMIVTDIYAAREVDAGEVSAADVVLASGHGDVQHVGRLDDVVAALAANVAPGDVVITLGAGDVNQAGERLLARLAGEGEVGEANEKMEILVAA